MKGTSGNVSKADTTRAIRFARLSDRELIDRAIAGEAKAKEEFVARFRNFLHRLLQESPLLPQEQEDCFQQIFVHLWEHDCRRLRQWKGNEQFLSWLRRVVRNLVVDQWRSQALRRDLPYVCPERAQDHHENACIRQIHAAQQADAVAESLRRLSALDAEMLIRRFYWGQGYREMAVDCRLTVAHLGVAFHRARRRMWRRLYIEHPDLFAE